MKATIRMMWHWKPCYIVASLLSHVTFSRHVCIFRPLYHVCISLSAFPVRFLEWCPSRPSLSWRRAWRLNLRLGVWCLSFIFNSSSSWTCWKLPYFEFPMPVEDFVWQVPRHGHISAGRVMRPALVVLKSASPLNLRGAGPSTCITSSVSPSDVWISELNVLAWNSCRIMSRLATTNLARNRMVQPDSLGVVFSGAGLR